MQTTQASTIFPRTIGLRELFALSIITGQILLSIFAYIEPLKAHIEYNAVIQVLALLLFVAAYWRSFITLKGVSCAYPVLFWFCFLTPMMPTDLPLKLLSTISVLFLIDRYDDSLKHKVVATSVFVAYTAIQYSMVDLLILIEHWT